MLTPETEALGPGSGAVVTPREYPKGLKPPRVFPEGEPVALNRRYHVPRSQVWAGSGGRQSGVVHLHVTERVDIGRLHRAPGMALCGRRGWFEREPMDGERDCPKCADIAHRYAITED